MLAAIPSIFLLGAVLAAGPPQASKVDILKSKDGAQLRVGGQPFTIRGAGGDASKAQLKAAGGNTFRTWGVGEHTAAQLDEAERLGLKVVLGIWLGHERHGFDYSAMPQVRRQFLQARSAVRRFKDHPALLAWGVGNEMEGFKAGDNPKIWAAVEAIAKMIKQTDPNHPTISVVAEIGGARVKALHELCPHVDIVGINSYGGAASVPERYRAAGGTKPYVVTEFGPPGTWEQPKNPWGVPVERTSTEKAAIYGATYDALAKDPLCLGAFAFTWGSKREATASWYGMFLPDGTKLGAVDVMTTRWSGKPPKNRCPELRRLEIKGEGQVAPGAVVEATLEAKDPEGDALSVEWVLAEEMPEFETGGDTLPAPPTFPSAIVKSSLKGATVRMPTRPGRYRLFVFIRDGAGGGATANLPLKVKGEASTQLGAATNLPLVVYGEKMNGVPYAPSGYMGDTHSIEMDFDAKADPKEGPTCLQVDFHRGTGWGGVAWQSPANDWGDRPGGYALTGARRLTLWARGAKGGEKVKLGFGLLNDDKPYFDSAKGEQELVLDNEWKRYAFELKGKNLDRIKTGFYWVVGGQGEPVRFFLDEIRYER